MNNPFSAKYLFVRLFKAFLSYSATVWLLGYKKKHELSSFQSDWSKITSKCIIYATLKKYYHKSIIPVRIPLSYKLLVPDNILIIKIFHPLSIYAYSRIIIIIKANKSLIHIRYNPHWTGLFCLIIFFLSIHFYYSCYIFYILFNTRQQWKLLWTIKSVPGTEAQVYDIIKYMRKKKLIIHQNVALYSFIMLWRSFILGQCLSWNKVGCAKRIDNK